LELQRLSKASKYVCGIEVDVEFEIGLLGTSVADRADADENAGPPDREVGGPATPDSGWAYEDEPEGHCLRSIQGSAFNTV